MCIRDSKRSDASEPEIRIYDDKGVITPEWMPICQGMPYRCTMIKTDSQTLRLNAFALNPLRLTAWEGNAILLGKPDGGLPTGSLCMRAYDRAGERLDARFEVYVGNELIMERDVLCDEDEMCIRDSYNILIHFIYMPLMALNTFMATDNQCLVILFKESFFVTVAVER